MMGFYPNLFHIFLSYKFLGCEFSKLDNGQVQNLKKLFLSLDSSRDAAALGELVQEKTQ
jgi:hypothetical protein